MYIPNRRKWSNWSLELIF